eukprot:122305-Lingulodinium_polyedra.AAC.1
MGKAKKNEVTTMPAPAPEPAVTKLQDCWKALQSFQTKKRKNTDALAQRAALKKAREDCIEAWNA